MESTAWHKAPTRPWNRSWNNRNSEYARHKPDGGFCFIPAMALIRAWWAYKQGIIRLADLRVWFACFEAVARRCKVRPDRFFRFTKHEIHGLVGGSNSKHIQTSIDRLTNARLLEWSEREIRFPAPAMDGNESLNKMLIAVANHRRKVPVPRRTLRLLAASSRPVMTATILGHLLRCMYYRSGACVPDGRCKASWVADLFEVDERNVKAARRELSDRRWLSVEESSQIAMNRWGARVIINLTWKHTTTPHSPPPKPDLGGESPPPRKNRKLSSRIDNQKPDASDTPGVFTNIPSFRHVRPEDLSDAHRLDGLLAEARSQAWLPRGEAAQLRFYAAAAHAIRIGNRNPAGLFATIVRRGLWSFLSQQDEDRARATLAQCRETPRQTVPENKTDDAKSNRLMGTAQIIESVLVQWKHPKVEDSPLLRPPDEALSRVQKSELNRWHLVTTNSRPARELCERSDEAARFKSRSPMAERLVRSSSRL